MSEPLIDIVKLVPFARKVSELADKTDEEIRLVEDVNMRDCALVLAAVRRVARMNYRLLEEGRAKQPTPYGLCHCGCGLETSVPTRQLEPNLFVRGHFKRTRNVPACGYVVDDMTGCWNWGLAVDEAGYGHAHGGPGRGNQTAHRKMWEEVNGPVPEGLHLDHLCRNRRCVNPGHLEPVTPAVNVQRSAKATLTPDEVRTIRTDARPHVEIARDYGVTPGAIGHIKIGHTWKDVV